MSHTMAHTHGSPSSLAFLAGIGAGVLAALLFAPRTGQETRSQLKEAAMNARRKAQQTMEDQKSKVDVKVDAAKDKLDDTLQKGADAVDDMAAEGSRRSNASKNP
ncbi:MAG TPA: YtxH domain-containing protein [Candidatus Saccharimonadales bacterium]|nr:YtxH domain-containing protein [Candidatus Saccharimonadales bacterium]